MRMFGFYIMLAIVVLFVWDACLNSGQLYGWLNAHASDTMYAFGLAQ
jgi:hypothetical protein